MGGDEDFLSLLDERQDFALVVRQRSLSRHFERFAARRRNVVRTTPDVNLVFAKLLAGLVLVKSSQVAIVT